MSKLGVGPPFALPGTWRTFAIMPVMSSLTSPAEVVEAVRHMPVGALLVIHGFSWDDYELLLEELGDKSHARVNYDAGRLEILSPSLPHDKYEWFLNLFVVAYCESRGLKLLGLGHTTWKKKSAGKGVEADACYYVNTPVPTGRSSSLEAHPPPDICVEVDVTNSSLRKLSIYAALGVPEVWIYDESTFRFYALTDGKYSVIEESNVLPGLTGPLLVEGLEACREGDAMDVLKGFRKRIQQQNP